MWKGSICYAGAIYYASRSIPSEKKSFENFDFYFILYGINANQNLNSYDFEKYLYREFVWKKIENF